jgi:predicted short-subunit dehydrogenase-like oxidoreductase (DUF2520 family)
MQKSIKNIAFAGSGNVAWHLAQALFGQGFTISGIWSRDFYKAASLAKTCNSVACNDISALSHNSDLIVVAVPDNAIEEVASAIGNYEGLVVHTAGSVPIEVLKINFKRAGVFYPLQTFSKEIPVAMDSVPFFIEVSDTVDFEPLMAVASRLSSKVYPADSHQRLLLHIAAVFAGNYSNLMYVIGNQLLAGSGLPTDVLHPLIAETAKKAITGNPLQTQTGPARRNDTLTIEKHLVALASMPEYAELYRNLANLISKNYK